MTASVLSLTVMSGLKSFHKSRLQSKQRLTKRRRERIWLSQQEQAACDPLSAGWLVLKQQDLVGRPIVNPSQPVSPHRPGFLILVTCMQCGICWKGVRHMVWHGTTRRNASLLTNVVCKSFSSFCSLLLFSKS